MSSSSSEALACATASPLELWLLTTAIVVSYFLSALPIKASSKIYEKGRRPPIFSLFFILVAALALSLSLATLILGYANKISLDAIAAIIFALIPGLVSFPRDAFTDLFVELITRHFRVFPTSYKKFAYITLGRPCKHGEPFGAAEDATPIPNCGGYQCEANVYIRYLAPRRVALLPKRRDEKDLSQCRWNGVVKGHTTGVVTLQNWRPVPEQKWYLAVSRSLWFVMQPWTVHLDTPSQVGQALRLVVDIVAIGRLVLYYRGDMIKRELRNSDIPTSAMKRTAIEICNALIHEMSLTEWREVDMMQIHRFCEEDLTGKEGEVYNVLFYYLTVKSHLFGTWFKWKRGEEELGDGELEEAGTVWDDNADEDDETNVDRGDHLQKLRTELKRIKGLRRTQVVSTFVQWLGMAVNNTRPFSSPKLVAAFRHQISAARIVKEIGRAEVSGEELDKMMRGKVDAWLRVWGCDVDSEA